MHRWWTKASNLSSWVTGFEGLLVLLSLPQHSGFMPEPIQNALLALAFLACGGLHVVLRLLSLHLCNEYPSLPQKKKKKKKELCAVCQSTLSWQAPKAGAIVIVEGGCHKPPARQGCH